MNSTTLKSSRTWRRHAALTFILPAWLLVAGCARHHVSTSAATASDLAGRVAFYNVPLRCPAAPEIGCGSRAKPVLLELERVPGINEAWLNRAGTIAAIVFAD